MQWNNARRMLRFDVLVNDKPQTLPVAGGIRRVEARRLGVGLAAVRAVEFWAEGTAAPVETERIFQVFGTGHELPEGAIWRGTTARTPDGLIWHLYELLGG